MHKMVQDLGSTILGEKSPFSQGFRQYKYKKSTRQSGSGNEKRGNGMFRSLCEIGYFAYLK